MGKHSREMDNSRNGSPVSRRQFLKKGGRLGGGIAAGIFFLKDAASDAFAMRPGGEACRLMAVKYELRFDPRICAGCACCEIACSQYHEGHAGTTSRNRFTLKPLLHFMGSSALSANAPGWPQPLAPATFAEASENEFCRQCPSPECLDACPEGAIVVDGKTGARIVKEKKCIGCGACVEACQWEMIFLDSDSCTAYKCDLCGGDPQCVKWCPTGAVSFHKTM